MTGSELISRDHSNVLERFAKISEMIRALEYILSDSNPKDLSNQYFQTVFDTYQILQLDVAALEKDLLILEQASKNQSASAIAGQTEH